MPGGIGSVGRFSGGTGLPEEDDELPLLLLLELVLDDELLLLLELELGIHDEELLLEIGIDDELLELLEEEEELIGGEA